MTKKKPPLVLDACVLIDFRLEDETLLQQAANHTERIIVLSPVLEEVNQLDENDCERLGLIVQEPSIELLMQVSKKQGRLSLRDRLCLAFAKERSYILCTNDKPLRNAASCAGVEVKWGLEILCDLVAIGELTKRDALVAARNICNRSGDYGAKLFDEISRLFGL